MQSSSKATPRTRFRRARWLWTARLLALPADGHISLRPDGQWRLDCFRKIYCKSYQKKLGILLPCWSLSDPLLANRVSFIAILTGIREFDVRPFFLSASRTNIKSTLFRASSPILFPCQSQISSPSTGDWFAESLQGSCTIVSASLPRERLVRTS